MSMNEIEDKGRDERLGTYLARAREAKGMTVDELATVTKLTVKNINLIESGDWKAFPVKAYLRGYLNSMSEKLGLDPKKVLEYYYTESGTKSVDLIASTPEKPVKVSPMSDEERKPRSKAVPIAIALLVLAFVVGSHFFNEMNNEEQSAVVETPSKEASVEAPAEVPEEMPEGAEAVAPDTSKTDSAVVDSSKDSAEKVTQAVVDSAVKKSDLPASATIFISSTSKADTAANPVSGKTHIELIGSGSMRSWVGLKRHEDDGSFVKEANITEQDSRMVYESSDTLYVVIGEPRAIQKMLLNGKEVKVPEMKYGRVAKFHVFGGEIVKKKRGR